MHRSTFILILTIGVLTLTAVAELPPLDGDRKDQLATHVITGKVVRIYTSEDDRGKGMINSAYAIEIIVQDVSKGDGIEKGKTVFVKTWKAKKRPSGWAGPGGQYSIPNVGDVVRVHMKLADDGFTALIPNGIEVVKP